MSKWKLNLKYKKLTCKSLAYDSIVSICFSTQVKLHNVCIIQCLAFINEVHLEFFVCIILFDVLITLLTILTLKGNSLYHFSIVSISHLYLFSAIKSTMLTSKNRLCLFIWTIITITSNKRFNQFLFTSGCYISIVKYILL